MLIKQTEIDLNEREETYILSRLKIMAEQIESGRLEYRITEIPPQAQLAQIACSYQIDLCGELLFTAFKT